MNNKQLYSGIWPVAPTPFQENGTLDLEGMGRIMDFMVDQGVDGICILANYSEQFLLSDDEREILTKLCLKQLASRVPAIVGVSHFSTDVVLKRVKQAKDWGASIVMMMPPYHGALMKGNTQQIYEQFAKIAELGMPIMLQDAPLSGIELPVELLAKMATNIKMLQLFKIESVKTADKISKLLDLVDSMVVAFDGEEGITLYSDLQAGATGSITSALIPDKIKPIINSYLNGDKETAFELYTRVLPIINYENRQTSFQGAKTAMKVGGILKSDFCRHPIPPLREHVKRNLIAMLEPLKPLVLNWTQ